MRSARTVEPAISTTGETDRRRTLLLCLSHLRWDFVFQRPQHLMTRAAQDWPVLFVEEPVYEAGLAMPRLDERVVTPGVTVAVPVLPEGTSPESALRAQRHLLDAALARRRPDRLIAWFYTPMALDFASHLVAEACVYDCMDELSAFRGAPPQLTANEHRLMARAEVMFTGGRSLYEAKRGRHPSVHAFPSSIDQAHFRPARKGAADPADQASLARPRIGYFGVIDERMDLGLVEGVARARPDWSIVMLGPVVKIDPASLPKLPNLHWLGSKPYAALPAYLANWQVGFMPFALNEATRFISPTKTPEFLAAGVPVVSTPIRDVVDPWGTSGLVAIASTVAETVGAIERAQLPARGWLAKVDRHLASMSWDRTWAEMQALIEASMARETRLRVNASVAGKAALANA